MKTEFFSQMDGITPSLGVLVLATTNCPWDLDVAVLRRLEKRIYLPLPDRQGRKEQLVKLLGIDQLDWEVDDELMELTNKFSGADLQSICREASMIPLRTMMQQLSMVI